MVRSDTIVGLIGAGVLVIALVGVFIIESQPGEAKSGTLTAASNTAGSVDGSATYTRFSCTPVPQVGGCAPNTAQTPYVTPKIDFELTLTNAPAMEGKFYSLFVKTTNASSPNPVFIGNFDSNGKCCAVKDPWWDTNTPTVIISIESSATPTAPTQIVFQQVATVSQTSWGTIKGALNVGGSASASGSFTATAKDNGVELSVTVKNVTLAAGKELRVYVQGTDHNATKVYAGNITALTNGEATAKFNLGDKTLDDATHVYIYVDATATAPPKAGEEVASPKGTLILSGETGEDSH